MKQTTRLVIKLLEKRVIHNSIVSVGMENHQDLKLLQHLLIGKEIAGVGVELGNMSLNGAGR